MGNNEAEYVTANAFEPFKEKINQVWDALYVSDGNGGYLVRLIIVEKTIANFIKLGWMIIGSVIGTGTAVIATLFWVAARLAETLK